MEQSPILLIEDDADDHEILLLAFRSAGIERPVKWFADAEDARAFLRTTPVQPFLIICDINMPKQNGVEFKRSLDNDPVLRQKSIPFVFYSTDANNYMVRQAYLQLTVQGFFVKEHDIQQMKKNIRTIVDYWEICIHPNS